jgi:hypothetical protein
MNTEITRANDADREKYAKHLSTLYAEGYVTDEEAAQMRDKIFAARDLTTLHYIFAGMPLPEKKMRISGLNQDHPERFWAAGGICFAVMVIIPVAIAIVIGNPVGSGMTAALWGMGLAGFAGLIALFVRAFRVFDW